MASKNKNGLYLLVLVILAGIFILVKYVFTTKPDSNFDMNLLSVDTSKVASILIKQARIINFDNENIADVLIKDGKIVKIGTNITANNAEIIEANSKYLFPGGIDPHVHMNLPTAAGNSVDDFISGGNAALQGGTTSIIDFVTPNKGQSLVDAYLKRLEEAKNCPVNVKFHVSPVEWRDTTAAEMEELVKKYGVKSFKIYTAYKNSIGIDDDVIIKIMQKARELDAIVTIHCEHGEIIDFLRNKFIAEGKTEPKYHPLSRPVEAEAEAIHRILMISKIIGTTIYIVHVSSKRGIEFIQKAQKNGQKVFAETCPHYLLLDDSVYNDEFNNAAKFILSPPIRKEKDQIALWEAIKKGNINTIGTDHCPFNLTGQKDKGKNDFTQIANGAGSVEHRLLLLLTYGVFQKLISFQKFIEITSKNPAKIFGLKNKGEIREGFDADLYIYNPEGETTISAKNHFSKSDNDIYEDFIVKGRIETVIINGEIKKNV